MTERIPDPPNVEEYNRLQNENQRVEGYGLDTAMSAPCPGCCAPDWSKWKIVEVEKCMAEEKICANCGRGFKMLLDHKSGSVTNFEMVQTCGDDLAPYLPPMRRIDNG